MSHLVIGRQKGIFDVAPLLTPFDISGRHTPNNNLSVCYVYFYYTYYSIYIHGRAAVNRQTFDIYWQVMNKEVYNHNKNKRKMYRKIKFEKIVLHFGRDDEIKVYIYYIFHRVYEPCSRCILYKCMWLYVLLWWLWFLIFIFVIVTVLLLLRNVVGMERCLFDGKISFPFPFFLSFWLREFGTKCVTNIVCYCFLGENVLVILFYWSCCFTRKSNVIFLDYIIQRTSRNVSSGKFVWNRRWGMMIRFWRKIYF